MTNLPIAQFVAITAATVAVIACVVSVFATVRTLQQATRLRSMTYLQGELIEIRDYVAKVDAWLKRINAREVMRERRDDARTNGAAPATSSARRSGQPAMTKDELRARAGIIAGRPAPHTE